MIFSSLAGETRRRRCCPNETEAEHAPWHGEGLLRTLVVALAAVWLGCGEQVLVGRESAEPPPPEALVDAGPYRPPTPSSPDGGDEDDVSDGDDDDDDDDDESDGDENDEDIDDENTDD